MTKVPCYWEDDHSMIESGSILRYLASSIDELKHLYPADPHSWHAIDSLMDFFCTTFWPKLEKYYLRVKVGPSHGHSKLPRPLEQKRLLNEIHLAFKQFESNLHHKFGALDQMTIADLQILYGIVIVRKVCHIEISEYPKLSTWY